MAHEEPSSDGASKGTDWQPPLMTSQPGQVEVQVRTDSRGAFERHEALEMSASRRQLWQDVRRWGRRAAGPGALLGWGLSYGLVPLATHFSPGWTRPDILTSALLGAACGWLGAAMVSLLVHSIFTEDRDIPVVVGGVTALGGLAGGLYGGGFGSPWAMAAALGLALPLALVAGIGFLIVYSTVRAGWGWARQQTGNG